IMLQELFQQPTMTGPLTIGDSGVSPELEEKLLRRAKGPFLPAMTGDQLMEWVYSLASKNNNEVK
ncbi:MAG: hypothetical protein ACREAU_11235, partial [Nitrosopumilaceae archaeon]